jgi:1-acyl-sn-glycerol-3-phosphate acyltransferase
MSGLLRLLRDSITTYASLAVLALICLSWTVFALPLYLLLPERFGTAAGRAGIMGGFRLYSWWLELVRAYRLDLSALDALRKGPSLILAPNHPSAIDALLILSRLPNLICVMKSELMHNVFLGAGARLARFVCNEPPRRMILDAVAGLERGGILMLFPEGTRSVRFPVNPLKASIGTIARHAGVAVQTLLIETDSPYLSKGWPLWRRPRLPIAYRLRLGRRFEPPADAREFATELEQYFESELTNSLQACWLGAPPPVP